MTRSICQMASSTTGCLKLEIWPQARWCNLDLGIEGVMMCLLQHQSHTKIAPPAKFLALWRADVAGALGFIITCGHIKCWRLWLQFGKLHCQWHRLKGYHHYHKPCAMNEINLIMFQLFTCIRTTELSWNITGTWTLHSKSKGCHLQFHWKNKKVSRSPQKSRQSALT